MSEDTKPGLIERATEESPGIISSIRLQMLVVLFMVAVVPLAVWAFVSIRKGELSDIPGGVITLCTLLAGASIGGKVYQQRNE